MGHTVSALGPCSARVFFPCADTAAPLLPLWRSLPLPRWRLFLLFFVSLFLLPFVFPSHTATSADNPHFSGHEWFSYAGFGLRTLLSSPSPPRGLRLDLKGLHLADLKGGIFSLRRTSTLASPPATRPPAEPPPSSSTRKFSGGSVSSANPVAVCCSVVVFASPILAVTRPSPKPPWPCLCFTSSILNHVSGYFVFLQISVFMVNLGDALNVFERMPHKDSVLLNILLCAFWRFSMIVETHVADNYCKDPPSYHPTSEHEEIVVNLETNNSRPALAEVKKIIRNWIGIKTGISSIDSRCPCVGAADILVVWSLYLACICSHVFYTIYVLCP